jgi:hypothetical protein
MTLEQVRTIIANGGKVTWNNMEIIDDHILCENVLIPLNAIGTPAGLSGFKELTRIESSDILRE